MNKLCNKKMKKEGRQQQYNNSLPHSIMGECPSTQLVEDFSLARFYVQHKIVISGQCELDFHSFVLHLLTDVTASQLCTR